MSSSQLSTTDQLKSIWHLGGLTVGQLSKRVWAGINYNDLFGLSSELAYGFILSIFPFLLFLLALFGLFASRGSDLRTSLMFYLQRALPPAGFQVISKTIAEVSRNTGTAKITVGLILALFTASGGMSSMISGLNAAYGVHDKRSWFKVRGISIILTIVLAIFATAALIIVLVGGHMAQFAGNRLHLGSSLVTVWKIAEWPFAIFAVSFAFALVYYWGPDLGEQHWYWITPGSFIGVLLWLGASEAFRLYLHYFNTYSKTYGSLGAVIILLVWFYVTGFAFLAGGEINAEIEHAAAEHGHPEAKPEGKKLSPAAQDAA
jgi:membrane protein